MAQRATDGRPPLSKNTDTTFGVYKKQDGKLSMGNKAVQLGANGKTLTVDDTEYKLTPGLEALIMLNIHNLHNIVMIIKHINHLLHRRLDHSQIWQVLLDHMIRENGSRCLGKWLYLGKG